MLETDAMTTFHGFDLVVRRTLALRQNRSEMVARVIGSLISSSSPRLLIFISASLVQRARGIS
jgi:hypothetical protein